MQWCSGAVVQWCSGAVVRWLLQHTKGEIREAKVDTEACCALLARRLSDSQIKWHQMTSWSLLRVF